ncbi:4Fe-4S ferredoxin [Methanobacterium sp. VT]|uniref:4Fe-4S ferredoxin n=1 Tax=Methanobacterium spitsbergense TaxID=2874285 RepID=A0A8T5V0W0_9EURY|nr:4Fe-4S ferredoxin [Methanobacterium spitsbergense]
MKTISLALLIIEKECEDYFFGIADLSHVQNSIIEQYSALFDEYPRAISIGITLPLTKDGLMNDNKKVYNFTDRKLNNITEHISNLLEAEGYNAFPFPKSEKTKDNTFISLNLIAANQANLGQIEKNGLLTTPEVGSAVNWGTVLIDAPIKIK